MKFKASIESSNRSYEVEFDLDDEVAAKARLAQALQEISKRFVAPNEKPSKPPVQRVTAPAAETPARKENEHAK